MKIAGWHIDGFGLFADYREDDLPTGLTVVHGPNEAGKSTILAFVRGVLFGFPDGRSKDRQYPPLRGGQAGGRLYIDSGDGHWVIERTTGPSRLVVTLPGGSPGSQGDLDQLLGHADRGLFRNIFAFTLGELDSFAALEADAVRERVFATPAMGAGRPPTEVMRLLDARRSTLLKPRASSEINELRAKLRATETSIREARRAAEGYPRAVRERERAEAEVDRLTQVLIVARAEVSRNQALIDLWPEWSDRSQAQAELEGIHVPGEVLPDTGDMLSEALRRVNEATTRVEERQAEMSRIKTRLDRIEVDDRLPDIAADVKRAYAGYSAHEANRHRVVDLEQDVAANQSQLADEFGQLGPGWDRQRIANFDVSIPTADEVRNWGTRLKEASDLVVSTEQAINERSRRSEASSLELDGLNLKLAESGDPPDLATLDQIDSGIRQIRALLGERTDAEVKLESSNQAVDESRFRLEGLPGAARSGLASGWTSYALAALLALAALAMGVSSQWIATAVLALAATVAVAVARVSSVRGDPQATHSAMEERLSSATTQQAQRTKRLSELEGQIEGLASSLGLPATPTLLQVEEVAADALIRRAARLRANELSELIVTAESDLHGTQGELERLGSELADARKVDAKTKHEWDAWRSSKGVPEPMFPETVTDLFTSIRRARERVKSLEGAERAVGTQQLEIAAFKEWAGRLLESAGVESGTRGSELAAALSKLHQGVLNDEKTRENLKGLNTAAAAAREALEAAEKQLSQASEALSALLTGAGASDVSDLRRILERHARGEKLREVVAGVNTRIEARVGHGEEAEKTLVELGHGEVAAWRAQLDQATETVESLGLERDAALRSVEAARQEERRVAESSDVASLAIDAEGLRHQLVDVIASWQTAVLARSLVEETLSRFEKKHQPRVVARASGLFKAVTAGHYESIVARPDALELIDRYAGRIDVGNLSTGTAEQLYLCIRFALAEEFAARGTALPLIMDEVLVNFDPARARAVAATIADVSVRHQVLMFTCHPDTMDMMKEACRTARVIELERFGGAGLAQSG